MICDYEAGFELVVTNVDNRQSYYDVALVAETETLSPHDIKIEEQMYKDAVESIGYIEVATSITQYKLTSDKKSCLLTMGIQEVAYEGDCPSDHEYNSQS